MLLGKEAILKAQDLTFEEVEVKEWGGKVRIRTLTGTERDEYEMQLFSTKGKNVEWNRKNFRSKLLVLTIVDEKNQRLFTEKDIDALGAKNSQPIDMLATIAMKINGIMAKDVDDLTKNS